MKTPILRKVSVLVVLFFVSFLGTAQTITNLEIENAPYACASPEFNDFTAVFDVPAGVFDNDNQFVLELSDVNGEFNANTAVMATIDAFDGNTDIQFHFPVPSGVQSYGSDQFKIRLRSTSPATEAVIPYEYHWYDTNLDALVLNNFEPLEICPQSSFKIELSQKEHQSYIWYKDGEVIPGKNNYFLAITEAGAYYVELDLGQCLARIQEATSNTMIVTVKPMPGDISASATKLCANEKASLTAPDKRGYTYQWIKDGVNIAGEIDYTLVVEAGGVYRCEIVQNGCTTKSNLIEIQVFENDTVTISPTAPEVTTGQSITLTAAGADSYEWRNEAGDMLSDKSTLEVTAGGVYTVFAKRDGFFCTVEKSVTVTEVAAPDPVDTDGDGVFDKDDECIDQAGPENNNGCPVPVVDIDGDGVADADDVCPLIIGLPEFNGCPDDGGQTPLPSSSEVVSKALTMNGDGVNDQWVLPTKYAGQPDVEVIIFAPTGEIVLKTKNYRNTWPEEALSNSKATEFYYYIIRNEKEVLKKGIITIIK